MSMVICESFGTHQFNREGAKPRSREEYEEDWSADCANFRRLKCGRRIHRLDAEHA